MGEPIREQEGRIFRKVAIVEDEEELTALFQFLDGVGNASGNIPQVTDSDIIEEVVPDLINGADASASGEHRRPLCCLCQCSSRMAPGFSRMFTPASVVAMGNSRTSPAAPSHPLGVDCARGRTEIPTGCATSGTSSIKWL